MTNKIGSSRSRKGLRRMMIAVKPGHHAECLAPLKVALQDAFDVSGLPHAVGSWKGGSNSNYVEFPKTRFYFKGVPSRKDPRIEVRFRAKGPVAVTIRTPFHAHRFVKKYAQ
jgi:hypothetical protein